ncbi:MAG: tetratricopeptide repeat protein, partial [Anaerolineae bacterium]|nr:tetratricopeptide repeat protein [Anaerolineae bacterium]
MATETATATPMPTATPIPPSQYLLEGDTALFEGDYIKADEAYSQTLLLDSEYALAYSHRAFLYALQPERWAASLELAQKAVELEPESSETWAYLSLVQTMNKHWATLPDAAEKAVDLDAEFALAHVALARAYLALNMADEAQEAVAVALELEPDNVLAWMVQADCYAALGQFDSALLAAAGATSRAPKFLLARLVLADIYTQATEYPEAEAELQQILEENPNELRTMVSSVYLDIARNDSNAASLTLRKLKDMAPDLPLTLYLR